MPLRLTIFFEALLMAGYGFPIKEWTSLGPPTYLMYFFIWVFFILFVYIFFLCAPSRTNPNDETKPRGCLSPTQSHLINRVPHSAQPGKRTRSACANAYSRVISTMNRRCKRAHVPASLPGCLPPKHIRGEGKGEATRLTWGSKRALMGCRQWNVN